MIYDIRGTSGSGKSTLVRKFLEYEHQDLESYERFGYYVPQFNLAIIGRYEVACGGCDQIRPKCRIPGYVKLCVKENMNVIMEGQPPALAWGLMKQFPDNYIVGFMSTPLEDCIERRRQRRIDTGIDPDITGNKVLILRWKQSQAQAMNLNKKGYKVLPVIDHDFIKEMITNDVERCRKESEAVLGMLSVHEDHPPQSP